MGVIMLAAAFAERLVVLVILVLVVRNVGHAR